MRTLNIGGRQGRGDPPAHPEGDEDCLLISRAFWIGGALSIACWVALLWAVFA